MRVRPYKCGGFPSMEVSGATSSYDLLGIWLPCNHVDTIFLTWPRVQLPTDASTARCGQGCIQEERRELERLRKRLHTSAGFPVCFGRRSSWTWSQL